MRATIGERVRTYRLRRGLTQARLAHMIGRSERWLIDVERGGVDPRLSDAVALARVLNVAIDELAGLSTPVAERTGRPPPRPPVHTGHRGRRHCSCRKRLIVRALIVFDEFRGELAALTWTFRASGRGHTRLQ